MGRLRQIKGKDAKGPNRALKRWLCTNKQLFGSTVRYCCVETKKKARYRPISSAGNTAITHSKAEIGLPTSHVMKSQNIQYFTLCLWRCASLMSFNVSYLTARELFTTGMFYCLFPLNTPSIHSGKSWSAFTFDTLTLPEPFANLALTHLFERKHTPCSIKRKATREIS